MKSIIAFSSLIIIIVGCTHHKDKGIPNLNLENRPNSVAIFGPDVISTQYYERDIAISKDGDEIYFTAGDGKQTKRCLVSIKKRDGKWLLPEILNFSGQYQDIEPFLSPDNTKLYFASNRPIYDDSLRADYNIWFCNRIGNEWTKPIALDSNINTKGNEYYPSVSSNGNLYFTATTSIGSGKEDIYLAQWNNGQFKNPTPLDSNINSIYYEFNAYISPDEKLLIFSSYGREDGFGGGDLYISRRDSIGNWTKAVNLGSVINSAYLDYCPFIDWDRNNFYFTSERLNVTVKINTFKELSLFSSSIENGYGNIYRIDLDKLSLH